MIILNSKEDFKKIRIESPNEEIRSLVQRNWDNVAKPLNGLGKFETIICQIGAITETTDIDISKKAIIVMCADNGVVSEGISQSEQDVTSVVTEFLGVNQSSVCKMASVNGVKIIPIDIGINSDKNYKGVKNKKVIKGTRNFAEEPVMNEQEVLQAIKVGIDVVKDCKNEGYKLIGTGEMGIGNTTTSSAMTSVLADLPIVDVTGRGAGLSDEGLVRKYKVIEDAVKKYNLTLGDPFEVLRTVGGLDIAGLVGICIGGALYKVPIVLDGLITLVAGLTAEMLVPGTKKYFIASHIGKEPAIQHICNILSLDPVIYGNMALGEGTGTVMMMALLDVAFALYSSETTFKEMNIDKYERFI